MNFIVESIKHYLVHVWGSIAISWFLSEKLCPVMKAETIGIEISESHPVFNLSNITGLEMWGV
jgi:hypothetical protein